MAIEIVDLPINSMVIFHSYVAVYQRVMTAAGVLKPSKPMSCISFHVVLQALHHI